MTDESGKILGSTALDAGIAHGDMCTYDFSVSNVFSSAAQYAVEVTHRGKVVISHADMVSQDREFSLTLGN